jgi:hypothetical protein
MAAKSVFAGRVPNDHGFIRKEGNGGRICTSVVGFFSAKCAFVARWSGRRGPGGRHAQADRAPSWDHRVFGGSVSGVVHGRWLFLAIFDLKHPIKNHLLDATSASWIWLMTK